MNKNQHQPQPIFTKAKLIYNPHAGTKRRLLPNLHTNTSLEDIKDTLEQYQIPVDLAPTKSPGHATQLAKESIKEGYKLVIAAGGDGTVGEVANGLVGSDVTLGIVPLGSFMNVAKMLSIPTDVEKAVALIKIGRSRKVDVGCVTKLSGEKLSEPYYFLENAGIGLEAELHEYILEMERGNKKAIYKIFHTLFEYYGHRTIIKLDDQTIETRAIIVAVANGPVAGAALPVAPKAKLNDHRLTVTIYYMTKFELIKHFLKSLRIGPFYSPKIKTFKSKKVIIKTRTERLVHADARLFGTTPVECKIIPNALNVIAGFPQPGTSSLIKRTLLDP